LDLDSSMKRLSSTKVQRPFVLPCRITNWMDCPPSGFDVGRCPMNLISRSLQVDAHNLNSTFVPTLITALISKSMSEVLTFLCHVWRGE
jgi:hypothetical protein